jgi:selenocysteine-specific elongation factor
VLLVVAADDGVMPQTEEHLDIVHLLGTKRGIVALTKVDLVEASRRAEVREEIEILLDGTMLEGSPIFEVSAVSGEGIPALRGALEEQVRTLRRAAPQGCFRLPVDRAFVMHGHGLVVTGTATAGSVQPGATVRVLPGGQEARVRTAQVHGVPVERAHFGQRIALNLVGLDRHDLSRGHVVCDPELDRVTARMDVFVELRPSSRKPLPSHSLVRLHLGTAEVMGKILWLDGRSDLAPKESTYAHIVLREPIAAFGGDRFVLRDQTARATIGGGLVLDPFAPRPHKKPSPRVSLLAKLHGATNHLDRLTTLLSLQSSFAVAADDLAAAANLRLTTVREAMSGQKDVRPLPDAARAEAYTTSEKWAQLSQEVESTLRDFHLQGPREVGMEMESLRSQLAADLQPKVFRAVVAELEKEGVLVRQDSLLRLPSHKVGLDEADRKVATRLERYLADARFTPPDLRSIETELKIPRQRLQDLLTELEREEHVVRVAPDLYFAAPVVDEARALIRDHATKHGQIDAATFRDLIGASRKFSIALLNYFDRTGFTLRVGDQRKVRG